MTAPNCANCGALIGDYAVTLHKPHGRHTAPGDYCHACAGLALRGWFEMREEFREQNGWTGTHRNLAASGEPTFRYLNPPDVVELVSRSGSHFFSRDTMRFFRGKLHDCYGTDEGPHGAVYLVTSEQFQSSTGHREPRGYTVRRINLTDCRLTEPEEAGGFQGCATLEQARTKAKRLAKGEPVDQRRGFHGKRGAA